MSNPLLPRELCRFRIADDEFVVRECKLETAAIRELTRHPMHECPREPEGLDGEVLWAAFRILPEAPADHPTDRKEELIAISWISVPDTEGGAPLMDTLVHWEFRGQGLGTVMVRQARNLALRYRIKEVEIRIPEGKPNLVLNREGFDFEGGVGRMVL